MAAEIIHDHDVARLENWNELLFDISSEAFAVDRSVEDAGSDEAVRAQGAEKGQRPPMAVRRKTSHPFALRSPPAQRGHAGLDPGLIDEDQALGIEARLPRLPAAAPARDVRTGLLKGEQRFF